MKLVEEHPVKTTVATIIAVAIFIVSLTVKLTEDRADIRAEIMTSRSEMMANRSIIARLEEKNHQLEKMIFDVRDVSRAEDAKLQDQSHKLEVAFTEIRTKLSGVEDLLVKIDQKIK